MIFSLFLLTAFLSIVRYFDLNDLLVALVGQPPEVYGFVALVLVAFRLGIAICKYYPIVVRFVNSMLRISEMGEDLFGRSKIRNDSKDSPFNQRGPRRQYHSSAPKRGESNRTSLERTTGHTLLKSDVNQRSIKSPFYNPLSGVWRTPSVNERLSANLYKTTLLRLKFNLEKIHDYLLVKQGAPLINILKSAMLFAGTRNSASSVKFCCSFARTCYAIGKAQGMKGLVKYLKANQISLQQSLGGHHLHDAGSLGCRFARTKSGMPRLIPQQFRMRIRAGDPRAIRLALTFLGLYRVLKFPGTLNVQTITNVSTATGELDRYLQGMIPLFVRRFVLDRFTRNQIWTLLHKYSEMTILPIFKGGPGASGVLGLWNTHPITVLKALFGLHRQPVLWEAFTSLIDIMGNRPVQLLVDLLLNLRFIGEFLPRQFDADGNKLPKRRIEPLRSLGKLGTKQEPAGKIRVFAMVDAWTQWTLNPLHKLIFTILRGIPMDGTFDQMRPLKYVKPISGLWSLDLSAATDRLPLSIQKELIAHLLNHEFAGHWARLLTYRDYVLRVSDNFTMFIRYAVGQPMGALSSWASLAFTHHFLVQCAAWRAGRPFGSLYTNYAVLGDDVVIGDRDVAIQYLQIMKSLGVGVNTSKSLLSHLGTTMEFAKKTIVNGVDCSPIAFKELYAATRNIGAFNELRVKTKISFPASLQALGVGWKVRSWLNKPLGKLPARIRLLILAANLPVDIGGVDQFFELGQSPMPRYNNDTKQIVLRFIDKEVGRLFERAMSLGPLSRGGETSYSWALKLALDIAINELELETARDIKAKAFPPEGTPKDSIPPDWKPIFSEDQGFGSPFGMIYNLTIGLAHIIKTLRVNQTRRWVVDLNRLLRDIAKLANDATLAAAGDIKFSTVYLSYLKMNRELASYDRTVLATSRPNPPEIRGIMDPQQVRLWKRWSQILQNTANLVPIDEAALEQPPITNTSGVKLPFNLEPYPAPNTKTKSIYTWRARIWYAVVPWGIRKYIVRFVIALLRLSGGIPGIDQAALDRRIHYVDVWL